MTPSILLIAPEPASTTISTGLGRELDVYVERSTYGQTSLSVVRREQFNLILLDENLAAAEPQTTEALYAGAGTASVLEMNLAICGTERVVRQVRATLNRRTRDEANARAAAAAAIGNELNASLTGLLLESQLALRRAGPELAPTLQHLIDLAAELRKQLQL